MLKKKVVRVTWASNEKVTLIGPTRFILQRYTIELVRRENGIRAQPLNFVVFEGC